MRQFNTYILILFIMLYLFYYFHCIEEFKNNEKCIILLGDSILKNDAYVGNGKNIQNVLIKNTNYKIYNYAKDNSKIIDVYNQINSMSIDLNLKNTYIFLSVGGNDLITHFIDNNEDITDFSILRQMFYSYKNVIKSIKTKFPNAKIIMIDVYYPNNLHYKQYYSIIKQWNNLLYNYFNNKDNHIYDLIKISQVVTDKDDYVFGIEPSYYGSKKIANLILSVN